MKKKERIILFENWTKIKTSTLKMTISFWVKTMLWYYSSRFCKVSKWDEEYISSNGSFASGLPYLVCKTVDNQLKGNKEILNVLFCCHLEVIKIFTTQIYSSSPAFCYRNICNEVIPQTNSKRCDFPLVVEVKQYIVPSLVSTMYMEGLH